MIMINEDEALTTLRNLGNSGAYRKADEYVRLLPQQMSSRPWVLLQIARIYLRQGKPILAEAVLHSSSLESATPGQRLILVLESASLLVFRKTAIREALNNAEAAILDTQSDSIDPAEWAEADRVHIRILLTAATYYEIPESEKLQAVSRLPAIAERLKNAGWWDESFAARMTYAEQMGDLPARIAALAQLAEDAASSGRQDLAGEAYCKRGELLLLDGAPTTTIQASLDKADLCFAQARHEHGPIDVKRIRSLLAIGRELQDLAGLESCLSNYQQIDYPRGALTVLMDLSQLAHERGEARSAAGYRQQIMELSDQVGMGLAKDSFQTAQIDLMMRSADYGTAIELCHAAIAANPPTMLLAGYEQLLATAYSFVREWEAADKHGRKAISIFEKLGAIESASNAVTKLASDLSSLADENSWAKAEDLLTSWVARDEQREDFASAINKKELLAQINILRYLNSPRQRGDLLLLTVAENTIQSAIELTQRLPEREAWRRLGNLRQILGQVYQGRGQESLVIESWQSALDSHKKAGSLMEVANCHYILGAIHLNKANQELVPNFGISESHFRDALSFYETQGMREYTANTHFMFARLYVNASARVKDDLGNQLLDAAVGHLTDGESDFDAIRREFKAGQSVIEVQRGKRVMIEKSQRIYELALDILCRFRPDPGVAWSWTQRSKARALVDILGTGSILPARVMSELEKHPSSYQIVLKERELISRIDRSPIEERIALRLQLEELTQKMRQDVYLAEYLELSLGVALDDRDLATLFSGEIEGGIDCYCIDWIAVEDRLYLLIARPGKEPEVVPLLIRLSVVRTFVGNYLAPESFRVTLRDAPELLHELDSLIAPLATLTNPGALLILSPTGPLHAVPLHVLEVNNEPLIVRNPIVYCPSLSVMRHCLEREHTRTDKPTAALFGDPSGDRPEAARLVTRLEQYFGVQSFLEQNVTHDAFTSSSQARDVIHFQGHAVHLPNSPLDSYLVLADGHLTARELFGLTGLHAQLVTLAACESASNVIAAGDEPLGLIPAFLYSGANSVLASLWKVNQSSAALLMQNFYEGLLQSSPRLNKAEALRQAMLSVRNTPGFEQPYHWSPFALYGDWH